MVYRHTSRLHTLQCVYNEIEHIENTYKVELNVTEEPSILDIMDRYNRYTKYDYLNSDIDENSDTE